MNRIGDFMENNLIISILLTFLTVATGITTILNFFNIRRKDNRSDDEKQGHLQADLAYIKSVLIDVRQETKEISQLVSDHGERLTRVEESCKQAHKRITENREQIEELLKDSGR